MPIEIRELVIRANVDNSVSGKEEKSSAEIPEDRREEIIAECVEQVMQLLRDAAER